jgi:hypothetical protein
MPTFAEQYFRSLAPDDDDYHKLVSACKEIVDGTYDGITIFQGSGNNGKTTLIKVLSNFRVLFDKSIILEISGKAVIQSHTHAVRIVDMRAKLKSANFSLTTRNIFEIKEFLDNYGTIGFAEQYFRNLAPGDEEFRELVSTCKDIVENNLKVRNVIFRGSGPNGKTLLIRLLENIMGENSNIQLMSMDGDGHIQHPSVKMVEMRALFPVPQDDNFSLKNIMEHKDEIKQFLNSYKK